ncbi:MAG TPA: hypothetical protein VJ784_22500 [Pyrinomonadaceae bacterium]|nr:hypothetical protein [Pyrinomonadaceae bacterium]
MSLWTSTVICVLLLQSVQAQEQQANDENKPVVIEKDWNVRQAYVDVFKILNNQNTCSDFYRGPRTATTVLNGFVIRVRSQSLMREVSFEMAGKPRVIRDPETGASYRLFEKTMVNVNGSFYQRRADPMRKFPSDVGNFAPGSRAARALILLHELGHLIQDDNGEWLIPDDGFDGRQSKENTLRVEKVCLKELNKLN